MIDKKQVEHVAKLARLGLKEGEAEKFAGQLSAILGYVDILEEVKEDAVLTSQVTGLKNVSREDKEDRFCSGAELLECTELPVESDQIKVKNVITI